jgi:hypothetical protein
MHRQFSPCKSLRIFSGRWSFGFGVCLMLGSVLQISSSPAQDAFEQKIRPLLVDYCITCHSTDEQAGELDLERFATLTQVKQDLSVWEHVGEQLALGTMPPTEAPQMSESAKQALVAWIQGTLDEVALANAGDPGPVLLRRLSNHEYTYTLRDLTGVESLDPAREFPVDGAAGEGFTNVGSALVMSPALLTKYLDAAKEVTQHLVLLPEGIRFSPSNSPQDWTAESLTRIRDFYAKHTRRASGDKVTLQGVDLDTGTDDGRLPLTEYLESLQSGQTAETLSPKYLALLREGLESSESSILLEPLRKKFAAKQLVAADIEAWQKVLWKFSLVGHIGRPNGPQAWQEPLDPLVTQQEFRIPFQASQDQEVYLVARSAGDGNVGDQVLWENARLIAKDRPELALSNLPELIEYLQKERTAILETAVQSLAELAAERTSATTEPDNTSEPDNKRQNSNESRSIDSRHLDLWRSYLGLRDSQSIVLEPLLSEKIHGLPNGDFIQGWTAGEDLSVLVNSSENTVRIPGTMPGRSVAVHPSPSRSVVVAWRSPVGGQLTISGLVLDAHLDCGDGVAWRLEVRRSPRTEVLAAGMTDGGTSHALGPFENVRVEAGQVVALVVSPRDHHVCDLTTIDLHVTDGVSAWDLSRDVSGNVLQGNPHGPWHFVSEPVGAPVVSPLPEPMARWCESPSPELAIQVRDYLKEHFPLTHPLLASAWRDFKAERSPVLKVDAPNVHAYSIPAELAAGAELVVSGRLASTSEGSVQLQVTTARPAEPLTDLVPELPIIVGEASPVREAFRRSFDQFRELFPIVLCYSRIVPVDEVVTLRLFYREDEHLKRLILSETEIVELDRLWGELLYVSEEPLKQVDAFEQIYEFATQDRPDLVVEFEKMREPIQRAAVAFRNNQVVAEARQKQALIEWASRAWRRPLSSDETVQLHAMPPRLMLIRILTSPAFLYRLEIPGAETGPINDWELATRLSYFLWSSLPDAELFQLATDGKLSDPDVLAAQARRMLKDERRIRRLATEFGCQYLHVRDVATLDEKSERHFPMFTALRGDMQEEVARFMIDLFQNNRPVVNLLNADYSYLNRALAEHYGVPFSGDGWQRVDGLQEHGRGGMLGFAATLAKHSGASRTSAILRGMWLSEVVLGEKTPNPPKGVPTLPEEPPAGLSERQLIERHSSDPACAGCHQRIDPYGFALEGFDAIGRLRVADTQAILYDGTEVAGMSDLRDYLVSQRRQVFARQFSRKLLGYALGRSVQLSDQPLIDQMVSAQDPLVGDLVEQIVRSTQFRHIRGNP